MWKVEGAEKDVDTRVKVKALWLDGAQGRADARREDARESARELLAAVARGEQEVLSPLFVCFLFRFLFSFSSSLFVLLLPCLHLQRVLLICICDVQWLVLTQARRVTASLADQAAREPRVLPSPRGIPTGPRSSLA